MKTENEINEKEDEQYNVLCLSSEFEKCNFLTRLIYLWKWKFFLKHYKNEIKLKDVPKGRKIDESNYVYNEFKNKYWNDELKRCKKNGRKPNLMYPLMYQYGLKIVFYSIFCFLQYFAIITQALYIDDLIKNVNKLNDNDNKSKKEIIFISCIIVFCSFIATFSRSIYNYNTNIISVSVRACLSQFIYKKSLRLSRNGLGKTSTGQIVNLLSADMNRLERFFNMLSYTAIGIILLGYAIFKLWKYLSYYTFYGVIFLVIVLIIQSAIGRLVSKLRKKASEHTDLRLKLINEFVNSIMVIKLYCWENELCKRIEEARKKEINLIKKSLYAYAVSLGLLNSSTKVVVFIILTTFFTSGGLINDRVIFVTLGVFAQVTSLLVIFVPHFILTLSNFIISIKRINKFLSLEERDQSNNDLEFMNPIADNSLGESSYHLNDNTSISKLYNLSVKNIKACYSITKGMDDQNFLEDKLENSNFQSIDVLNGINFDCKSDELIIIVGAVGSGKSSLLQALLSELKIKEGCIDINGTLSYCSQEPFIFTGTIRENILFDSEYDQEKYNEIIKVCALERDLTLFQNSDMTLIGEKGINLSGGQKARINLARALYLDADIYLLDDPLSAVDTHVTKHIFKYAIKDYLKNKTVILVTHQLNYVKYADKILFIKDGEQVFFYQSEIVMKKLINEPNSEFAKFISTENQGKKYSKEELISITNSSNKTIKSDSLSLDSSSSSEEQLNELEKNKNIEKEKRIQEEDSKVHFVYKSYLTYFKYGKISFFAPLVLFVFCLNQFFATSSDFVLKIWSDSLKINKSIDLAIDSSKTLSNKEDSNFIVKFIYDNNVYVYSSLIILFFFSSSIRTIIFNIYGIKTAKNIHRHSLKRIVRAKMTFFYLNSIGVILNRFSRDIGIIDNDLILVFHDFLEILISGLVILLVMTISNPFLIFAFLVFTILTVAFRNFYIPITRSLEVLEGVAKSSIIQQLTSTLNGLSTVRAFKKENQFFRRYQRVQNDHTALLFATQSCKRWFTFQLDIFQLIFIAICFLVLTIFANMFSGSMIGLIVNYILQFVVDFQWAVICWSYLETYLCAVDRIEKMGKTLGDDKTSLEEPSLESKPDCKPPSNWPQKAIIKFDNVIMRYFKNEEPVLKNLSFIIKDKDKIGIVGRTGAGKSSIINCLFRLTDYEGDIIIDGINCKSIGLHDLRSKISIIPQDPVLFTGTIRYNLDPLGKFQDDKLWDALKKVQLEKVINELEGGLGSNVTDNGGNFSVGQKQLICLARAILKENRILILDEATANCDPRTDHLIQSTIRNVFKDCSILTIAHRLNTIMDSTKILVLEAGELVEFDTPLKLLKNETSLFRNMVYANGEEQAKNLIKLTEEKIIY